MWYCYLLKNSCKKDINRTYNGMTNNLKRRIRQHNQEIKGGAKYTHNFGNKCWEIYAFVGGFPNKINTLQCEWRIKHPDNKRRRPNKYNSPCGRIKGLHEVLQLNKWTNNSIENNKEMNLTLWIHIDYIELINYLPDNINIITFDNINQVLEEL
jgi:structure-specific endonuclease subunit SLX1